MARSVTRRRFCVASLLLSALFLISGPLAAKPGDTKSFVLLHTNDQHGHLLPFSYPDRVSPGEDIAGMLFRKNIGGIARRATLVQQIRRSAKNVFLFDGGDCMDGTPFSTEYLAKADYDTMNRAGYDYGVFGNHDFNMTAAQFQELIKTVRFKLLLANVVSKSDGKAPLPPYTLANWDGLRVAIFGLVTGSTRTYKAAAEAYTVEEPIAVARRLVPELRRQADLVIAVTHIGLEEDKKMAREVPGIDIIVGGHSHTRLPVGAYETPFRPGPMDPKGTIIVQAHQWGGELGRLDLTLTEGLDKRWRITKYNETLIPVTSQYAEHPEVARTVASYWDRIKAKYGQVIGQAAGEFSATRSLDMDSTNYYLVADAVQAATGAEFDLENRSGVRDALLKGPITYGDLIGLDPFENTVYTFKIKGSDLKKLLVATRPMTSASLRYEMRRSNTGEGGSGGGWTLVSATVNGQPVEDERVYTAATNSYYFGASAKPFAQDAVDTRRSRRDVIGDYIRKNSPIKPVEDRRVNFNGADPYPSG